jgi:methylated-DNA-[protein]-cysteine S-methyltransferase
MQTHYAVFGTRFGAAGIAWGDQGILGIQLPEADAARIRTRLRRRFPTAQEARPSVEVREAIAAIERVLAGERNDLSAIQLDMRRVPEFAQRVYEIARSVKPGETRTYGQIAEQLGDKLLARDVGQALARNPYPIVVPCHRILAAGGKLGGFSAAGGVATKQRLLANERADVSWQLPLDA